MANNYSSGFKLLIIFKLIENSFQNHLNHSHYDYNQIYRNYIG